MENVGFLSGTFQVGITKPDSAALDIALSVTSLAVYVAGPVAGPYALIFFSSIAGAMWPLTSTASEMSKIMAAGLLLRCSLMALTLTGSLALIIGKIYPIPATELLAPISFLIGALGNGWRPVFEAISDCAKMIISRFSSSKSATPQ